MPLNKLLTFADTDIGTNLLTDANYLIDSQRIIGHQPGTARDQLANKAARQSSLMTAALGEYLITKQGSDVTDALSAAALAAIIDAAITAQVNASLGIATGDVKMALYSASPLGWLRMNDLTIGSAASGATGRANADCANLYTVLWNEVNDLWAPVTGGRGANAAADFAANKPLSLPKALGRALAGYGTGTVIASGVNGDVDTTADMFAVPANSDKWVTGMPVVLTLSSGTITPLVSGTTYYIVRTSTTTVQLASSLSNAQNGLVIDLTAKSSPVWILSHTYTARALGESIGHGQHAMTVQDLLLHGHIYSVASNFQAQSGTNTPCATSTSAASTNSTGGNNAMDIMNPTLYLNVFIKL